LGLHVWGQHARQRLSVPGCADTHGERDPARAERDLRHRLLAVPDHEPRRRARAGETGTQTDSRIALEGKVESGPPAVRSIEESALRRAIMGWDRGPDMDDGLLGNRASGLGVLHRARAPHALIYSTRVPSWLA